MEDIKEENLDSSNEEQEDIDSPSDEQEETEEVSKETSEEKPKEEKYTEREKQLYAQLQKAKGFVLVNGKWVKPEKKVEKTETPQDEITLSRLEVRGVMEKEDQEYVLRFAKSEGVSPIDALEDPIVKDRLKANERSRNSEKATPRSNNRTADTTDEVDMWVKKYQKTGELPENNPALTSKILDKLAGA